MSFFELMIIAIGLSMDSFSVSICKGLSVEKVKTKHVLLCGIFFGIFQGLMPLIGYFLGISFSQYVEKFDHWIAFGLLAYIGYNMIKEALENDEKVDSDFSLKAMLVLAIATSIDALTMGVSFAFLGVDSLRIWLYCGTITLTTFTFSCLGVLIGHKIGGKLGNKAEIAGGIVLILLGIKILIEHLMA